MGGGADYYGKGAGTNRRKNVTNKPTLPLFPQDASKKPTDIAFSLDTTGTMFPSIEELVKNLEEIINRVKIIPNLRIAIIAHGDYFDQKEAYVIKTLDFTRDPNELIAFMKRITATTGYDSPECYELALKYAQSLSWDPASSKILAVVGDDIPHPASYTNEDIFWGDELQKVAKLGVVVCGVQALFNKYATPFYSEIATRTGGYHALLPDLALITELFVAMCFRAVSQEKFEEYKKQAEEKGPKAEVKQLLAALVKPTEKAVFNTTEPWYDRKYDKGEKPQFGQVLQWVRL